MVQNTPSGAATINKPRSTRREGEFEHASSILRGILGTSVNKEALLDRLSGTHMVDEHKRVLLHGYLRIQIIQAKGLRNFDCLGGWACADAKCCAAVASDLSDPYVTVDAGTHRLIRTKHVANSLDPVFNEQFLIPVAHYIDELEFRVKDLDLNISMDLLGKAQLPVEDIIKLDESNKPIRTGIHRIVNLDDKPRHGTLEFAVEFVPAHYMTGPVTVSGTYFEPRLDNNDVRLYINADVDHDKDKSKPVVTYGPGNKKEYKPARCWKDIYESMCEAKHFIYIAGWSVDHTQSLLRGAEKEQALKKGSYSPVIGDLLKKKAEEGVTVNIIVWDDRSSNAFKKIGVMGTHDEELREFCVSTKINLCLAPIVDEQNNMFVGMRNAMTCTHHQKMVACDHKNSIMGYVGGIDLTTGRYESHKYPLFRKLASIHIGDFYNGCATLTDGHKTGPRQPWHDIHASVRHGPAVMDLIKNFEERWSCQAADMKDKLVDIAKLGLKVGSASGDANLSWSCQLFRSIDARTAKLDCEEGALKPFDQTSDVTIVATPKQQPIKHRHQVQLKDPRPLLEKRFEGFSIDGFDFSPKLHHERGIDTDTSAHRAMVHQIRRAEHCIYIENQYFLSSAHMWRGLKSKLVPCNNLVAAEIALKICEKIEAGQRFAAYILLPMWSEGIPESSAVQEILHWQYYTIESMFTIVATAIAHQKAKDQSFDAKPSDYLNFYCLGNRETVKGSEAAMEPQPDTPAALLKETRRHLVYVHSKMTIVDDAVALIGSSNINQRSLDGSRDSELLMGLWQQKHLAGNKGVADGDVHAFRMQCFVHLTGVMDDAFREPSSLACVKRMNKIAEENWKLYTQEAVCDLKSYLLPYPITVTKEGRVKARTENGYFPDTKAKVTGADSLLPDFLTT